MASSLPATSALGRAALRRAPLAARVSRSPSVPVRASAVEDRALSSIAAPANFVAPEPRKFTVAEGSLGRVASSAIPLVLRAGTGALINGWSPSLVDDDGEGYSLLRVAGKARGGVRSRPAPRRPDRGVRVRGIAVLPQSARPRRSSTSTSSSARARAARRTGARMAKAEGAKTFPYMRDPNTGAAMAESDDIVEYLFRAYGPYANRPDAERDASESDPETLGVPFMLRRGAPLTNATCYAAAVARLKGLRFRPSRASAAADAGEAIAPLTLWTYEASPFTKAVRESLTELAIPHVVRYCPRGSEKRAEMIEKTGRFQVPFLEDPNTGIEMFESADIVEYVENTYALESK